ncbi:MAG: ABC transporter substrate-binding protein [Alphaproteobacteria bacterium]|nr:MAG: ABC transporter substrate-binding protein [Alphaproteobacteria bacterium]
MTKPIKRRELGTLAAGATLAATMRPAAAATKVLRYVRNGNLTILDPIQTTAYVTRDHGYMIYDTLLAIDENNVVKPQMLAKYEVSADKMLWTFTLRDGLEWHDGKPVTSADCVPSVNRWMARDPMGQKLKDFVAELKAVDDKTFTLKLKEPYGLVLDSLGKPSSNTPFMMPKAVAETDPFKQIDSTVGSGPFIYVNAESKPGEKHVYIKNPKYKPRPEPASGLAGGKVVKVDRVEWRAISDQQQAVNALLAGEIDFIEQPSHDLHPLLKADANIKMWTLNPLGSLYFFRPNHLNKPFDDPKIRSALWYALNQEDFLRAAIGDSEHYKVCRSQFICGTRLESAAGMDGLLTSNFEKARAVLKDAGYDGTPIVLMHSTDLHVLANVAPVAKQLMEKAGFKVDMQSMDMQTLVARRAKRDAIDKGGWHAFITSPTSLDGLDPITASTFNAGCEKGWPGWPCDAEMEMLRDKYARETDPAKQKTLADAIQVRSIEITSHINLGQFLIVSAARKNVTGFIAAGPTVFWNVEKK